MKFTREQMLEKMELLIKERYNITTKDLKKYANCKGKRHNILTDEEKKLINMKFGFNDGKIMTLHEISSVVGYSYSNVSKKLHMAFAKMYGHTTK